MLKFAAGLAAGALAPFGQAADEAIRLDRRHGDLILGGCSYLDAAEPGVKKYRLSAVNLATRSVGAVPMGFFAHGIAFDPLRASRIIVTEKIGPGACEIDLAERRVTRTIPPVPGRWFYGHGAFSPDGRLLYTTETVNAEQRGVIGVRDARSLEVLGEFPTYGENPHDCHLLENGKVMLVTNGGGPSGPALWPCVTFVEVASRKLLEKLPVSDGRFNTGHVTISRRRDLVVVSAPRMNLPKGSLGAVSLRLQGQKRGGKLAVVTEPAAVTARMKGEALSTVIYEPGDVAAVTHPDGDMITFWSMSSGKLVKALDIPNPRGVTLTADGRNFLFSYGRTADLVAVSPATLAPVESAHMTGTFITGSHLFNWNRLAATG